ncbi:hypothetical protein [Pseudomonas gessardii]|uniref:Peptidase C58 YopT-type domain-containing protein n=1 Tax=Pseudomonas gessardii TaxID=78544 RepID=A0A7Y1MRD9_9PSED|nr:hypothetical protein [Pseudomonas gessardii]NNA96637.1 hypothetical protein [Pseudomonas gessardii]
MRLPSLPNTLSFVRSNDPAQNRQPTSHEEPAQGQLSTHNDVPERRRVRRDIPATAAPEMSSADDFFSKVEAVKQGQGREAYMRGYNSPGEVPLPDGYSDSMSSSQFYKMALKPGVTDEQLGMLKYLAEKRTIIMNQENVLKFADLVSSKETKLTPMPQSYYLSMINQSSGGQCAGIIHLLSLATIEGKADIFLGNIYQALASPDTPESKAFFAAIARAQKYAGVPNNAHDPATDRLGSYKSIVSQILKAKAPTTLIISNGEHRLSAGVTVGADGKPTYYYADPNIGLIRSSSAKAFTRAMKKIFTDPDLKKLIKPYNDDLDNPKYRFSVFDPDHIPELRPTSTRMRLAYNAPLADLDTIKVVDSERLPSSADFRKHSKPIVGMEAAVYQNVLESVDNIHAKKGMAQYHATFDSLKTVQGFIKQYPGSPYIGSMQGLEQKLVRTLAEATPPPGFPYIDRQMQRDRQLFAPNQAGAPLATLGTPTVISKTGEVQRLQALDDSQPPIRIGTLDISRVDLYKMGINIHGKPIEAQPAGDPNGKLLATNLQIDFARFKAWSGSGDVRFSDQATKLFFEIAIHRDPSAGPLIPSTEVSKIPDNFEKQMQQVHKVSAQIQEIVRTKQPMPANFFDSGGVDKFGKTRAAGLGFQAFSTFQGLRSAIESFQKGDVTQGSISLGAVAAQYGGDAIGASLNKLGQSVIQKAAPSIMGFKASSVGQLIGKVGTGAGTAISLPFDIYSAVDSFKKASNSSGTEAQDHYVDGAFSVANAATSVTLGAAFMMGATSAGPIGLAVAGTLMMSQMIYHSVRSVEDLDKVTPLTGEQKAVTGARAFLGLEPGFDVLKPYLQTQYTNEIDEQRQSRYKAFLSGDGKHNFERVVYGSSQVEVKQVDGNVPLTPRVWFSPVTWLLNLIPIPGKVPSVTVHDGNDQVGVDESYASLNGKPVKQVEGELGDGKATLWDLGGGDDYVRGVENKPNVFLLGAGKKVVSGGRADDTVVMNADARQTLERAREVEKTGDKTFSPRQISLEGGEGRNTLVFSGELSSPRDDAGKKESASYVGHVINLKDSTVSVKTENSNTLGVKKIASVQNFSNVTTVKNGESYVQGDDQNNLLTLNGREDIARTGKGADVVVINGGARVIGEGGSNTYIINKGSGSVHIDDPEGSSVQLDYTDAEISDWQVTSSGDLKLTLNGGSPEQRRSVEFKGAFSNDPQDQGKSRPVFITSDRVMLSVIDPRKNGSSTGTPQIQRLKVGER